MVTKTRALYILTFACWMQLSESTTGPGWVKALPANQQAIPSESECRPFIEKAIKQLASDPPKGDSVDIELMKKKCGLAYGDGAKSSEESVKESVANDDEVTVSVVVDDGSEETEVLSVEDDKNGTEESKTLSKNNVESDEITKQDNKSSETKRTTYNSAAEDSSDEKPASQSKSKNDGKTRSNDKGNDKVGKNVSKSNSDEEDDEVKIKVSVGKEIKKKIETKNKIKIESKPTVSAMKSKKREPEPVPEPESEENNILDDDDSSNESDEDDDSNAVPEEELSKDNIIPKNLRNRKHIEDILELFDKNDTISAAQRRVVDNTLKELKRLYDAAIKPLEVLYKFRELSNRHFGDAEIFSKPLIVFMGPWSGGKSSIINYLVGNEFQDTSLRTGAEPSPPFFNILMHGENKTRLDGTQLAADWTFSGLQKFGQALLDRLKGYQTPSPLLKKVNIVEIPGILEIRKHVDRAFPFNDVCQWFIDRADMIFLVYDPSKLDVGPETEAILDQLKGREYQTRILLNKADRVKAEELMRVQSTLVWNISPLMSSAEPPVMYSVSLWSMPYEKGAPSKLLHSQEVSFLKDLKNAIDKRVESKIGGARRFAVRVRNHAKMVDCYLTTYYNHKSFLANRKKINADIVEHPENYHIFEGLSTLTNISRYDLPDPEVYRNFFRLHPIYEFQKLSDTCTYFRGCPINRLDIAIAYDLPELVGKYKTSMEEAFKNPQPVKKVEVVKKKRIGRLDD